ncbi:MAG: galactokinase [Planctomycetota bacterium]
MDAAALHARDRALAAFERRWDAPGTLVASAPGRVNLIGEHVDYNDGIVLPIALEERCWFVAGARTSASATPGATPGMAPGIEVLAVDLGEHAEIASGASPETPWARLLDEVRIGVCEHLGVSLGGWHVAFSSDVPRGGGLSSSAAVEVAWATLILGLLEIEHGPAFDASIDPMRVAMLCRDAEHRAMGVPCGVMDQAVSVLGTRGHALRLDCRSLEWSHVPAPERLGGEVLLIDSGVRHSLASSAYAERRATCEAAAAALGVASLRDSDTERVESTPGLTEPQRACARHATSEIQRTIEAADALASGDLEAFGARMNASHDSLRDDYRVSCAEVDEIVDAARRIPEVLGARMTGGGFGGYVVALCRSADRERFIAAARDALGPDTRLSIARAGEGRRWESNSSTGS